MPGEKGQKCRTIAQKAMEMESPCIQITPMIPTRSLDDLAKFYFYVSKMAKSISKELEVPLIVDFKESGVKSVQCEDSDTGYHEFMEIQNEIVTTPTMLCIHCGVFAPKTTMTTEQLKKFFEEKKFKKKEFPRNEMEF